MILYEEFKDDLPRYREHFDHYRERVLELLGDEHYRYERYGVKFGTMLVYANEAIAFVETCRLLMRRTDKLHALEENVFLAVFEHVDSAGTLKAAQNLLHAYLNNHVQEVLYCGVASIEQNETATDIASRLFLIVEFALKRSLTNGIVDMNQMRI